MILFTLKEAKKITLHLNNESENLCSSPLIHLTWQACDWSLAIILFHSRWLILVVKPEGPNFCYLDLKGIFTLCWRWLLLMSAVLAKIYRVLDDLGSKPSEVCRCRVRAKNFHDNTIQWYILIWSQGSMSLVWGWVQGSRKCIFIFSHKRCEGARVSTI